MEHTKPDPTKLDFTKTPSLETLDGMTEQELSEVVAHYEAKLRTAAITSHDVECLLGARQRMATIRRIRNNESIW